MKNARMPRMRRLRLRVSGTVFLIMTVLAVPMAWNTGNQLLYILLAGFAAFLFVSFIWAVLFSLRGLDMRRDAPYAVQRDEPFWVRVRISNPSRLLTAFFVRIEKAGEPGSVSGFVPVLPRRRAAVLNVRETVSRRGVHRLPPYELASGFPFGFIDRRKRFPDNLEVIVYPRVYAVRTTVLEQYHAGRHTPQNVGGDGDEFFNLRDYVIGDDVRRIAWRVSARVGRWVVREMTRSRSRFIVFNLDTLRKPHVEDYEARFEDAVELVASLAVTLLRQHYNVAIHTAANFVEGGEGTAHELRVLDLLARIEPLDADEIPVQQARPRAPELEWATLIHVSPDPNEWGGVDGLSRTRVLDPREVVYV